MAGLSSGTAEMMGIFNANNNGYPVVNIQKLWKITILMVKSTINGPFSIAMLNYQRVIIEFYMNSGVCPFVESDVESPEGIDQLVMASLDRRTTFETMNSSFCHWDFGFKSQNMGHVAEKTMWLRKNPVKCSTCFSQRCSILFPRIYSLLYIYITIWLFNIAMDNHHF